MTLPTPAQLAELSKLIVEHGKLTKGKWYTYKGMMQTLERARGDLLATAVGSGAKSALTKGAGILGVSTGTTIVPFGAALAPWIAAADVVRRSGDIFKLHDLKEHA